MGDAIVFESYQVNCYDEPFAMSVMPPRREDRCATTKQSFENLSSENGPKQTNFSEWNSGALRMSQHSANRVSKS